MDGIEYGDTKWRCACGAQATAPLGAVPDGWARLEITIGSADVVKRQEQKKILCPRCAGLYLTGQARLYELPPGPMRMLPPPRVKK